MTDEPVPAPVLDAQSYTAVVIVKTGEVDGHLYRRGATYMVDAPTLQGLKAGELIAAAGTPAKG